MGIDITVVAERRRKGGPWTPAERMVPNPRLDDPYWQGQFAHDPERWRDAMAPLVPEDLSGPVNRAYGLYAVLSSGHPLEASWGGGLVVRPVAPPRGFPADASEATRRAIASFRNDVLDVSWLLVRELLDYDWDQEVRSTQSLKSLLLSDRYASSQSALEADWTFLRDVHYPNGQVGRWYVQREGTGVPARVAAKRFLAEVLPTLRSYGPPDDVRVVFWYH